MSELRTLLADVLQYSRPPLDTIAPLLGVLDCPKGFATLLGVANGFITKERLFRVFGSEGDELVPSVNQWNASPWKEDYGPQIAKVVFIGEDVFGDQYGYRFGETREFVKFFCEGGDVEAIPDGINWFIEALLDPFGIGALDKFLISQSHDLAMTPNADEHLAFKVPLIVGGKREVSNLVVESTAMHLGLLAQLTRRNRELPEGARIDSFRTDKGSGTT